MNFIIHSTYFWTEWSDWSYEGKKLCSLRGRESYLYQIYLNIVLQSVEKSGCLDVIVYKQYCQNTHTHTHHTVFHYRIILYFPSS